MKTENILPVNAFYLTWLRDKGKANRPVARWVNKKTGEVTEKTEMSPEDMLLYVMLLSRADAKTLQCFPSIDTICSDCCGLDRRKVWRHISELEQMGFIEVRRQKGRPNVYYMKDFAEWKKKPGY